MVVTDKHVYYLAVGMGALNLGKDTVIVLSPQSPLAISMKHLRVGDSFQVGKLSEQIEMIY